MQESKSRWAEKTAADITDSWDGYELSDEQVAGMLGIEEESIWPDERHRIAEALSPFAGPDEGFQVYLHWGRHRARRVPRDHAGVIGTREEGIAQARLHKEGGDLRGYDR